MTNIGIRRIEIQPNPMNDSFNVYITYEDCDLKHMSSYSVSIHKAIEYCMSATKNFNSLYISALERALELFNWDVLEEQERKGIEDGD